MNKPGDLKNYFLASVGADKDGNIKKIKKTKKPRDWKTRPGRFVTHY